ncbi:MAG: TorF family putative porin [Gemmobacter sp.]
MRPSIPAAALALALSAPLATVAAAEGVTVSGGFTITSEYMSNGLRQSDGPAFQPWVEAEINGFYAGIWASNTDLALTGGRYEVDLYAGYRNEIGAFSYDFGYARYYYRNPSSNCCGEVYLNLGVAVTDRIGVGTELYYDPSAEIYNISALGDYAATDRIGLSAELGRVERSHNYWSVGASYGLTDSMSVDLAWHDSNIDKGRLVLSLSMDFALFPR